MSDSEEWALDASDSPGSGFGDDPSSNHGLAGNAAGDDLPTIPMSGTLLYAVAFSNSACEFAMFMSCGRYLPDQNLIFDTATELVYANIGTLQSRPRLSAAKT
jgi:hypothetical protein